jgi:hypothetical protein
MFCVRFALMPFSVQIAVSFNGQTLAFSTDSGSVGVVELVSRRVRRMKTRHTNVRLFPFPLRSLVACTPFRSAEVSVLSLIDTPSSSLEAMILPSYTSTSLSVTFRHGKTSVCAR